MWETSSSKEMEKLRKEMQQKLRTNRDYIPFLVIDTPSDEQPPITVDEIKELAKSRDGMVEAVKLIKERTKTERVSLFCYNCGEYGNYEDKFCYNCGESTNA